MTVLAAAAAATAAWLLTGAPLPRTALPWPSAGLTRFGTRPGRVPLLAGMLVATVGTVLVVLADGTDVVLGAVLTLAGLAVSRLWASVRRRRRAAVTEKRVLELCESLAADLRSGRPPPAALEDAAVLWPVLRPVATAARLDGDVPAAFADLARIPGAAGLVAVAAAWRVSHTSGAGLADALARVAATAREERATRRVVTAELASAQATARILAVLPVAVLTMGTGVGGDPWGFLLGSGPGLACLAAGLALTYLGLRWIERIAVSVTR